MPSRREAARRYLALIRAVARARRAPFDPFKLTWILTERCSLRCATCHLWAGEPRGGPTLETVRAVLSHNQHLTWLNLSGGDLVERPDAPALLAAVAEALPDLALLDFPTAGQDTAATLAALRPLLDSEVPRIVVTVSLDGPDRKWFERECSEREIVWPQIYDGDGWETELARKFYISGIPTPVLLDREGRVAAMHEDARGEKLVEKIGELVGSSRAAAQ